MSCKAVGLGELLLCRLKCFDGCSPKDLPVDYIALECTRSDGVVRAAHRCVLDVGSDYFSQELGKLSPPVNRSQKRDLPNVLRVDASPELIDIILEHLYTREPIQFSTSLVVKLYAAAKLLQLNEVAQQGVEYLRLNLETCLEDDNFLDSSNSAGDVDALVHALDYVEHNVTVKFRLMEHVKNWSIGDIEKSSTAWKICEKLISIPNATALDVTQETAMATMAIVGYNANDTLDFRVLSVPSMAVLFGGRVSGLTYAPNEKSIIFNNNLYIPWVNAVYVRRPNSNVLIREITKFSENSVRGVCVFRDEVFFHTSEEIYILDPQGVCCTKMAQFKRGLNDFVVLKRDAHEFTLAVPVPDEFEVRQLTFRGGCSTVASSVKLQMLPRDMRLIGSHRDLLYFRSIKLSPFFYAAFRGDVEIKRHPVKDCHRIIGYRICRGVLYLVYSSRNDSRARYVMGIDLDSDKVVFKKLCSEFNLQVITCLVPVVGVQSDRKP